jgi:hypothetical protein
VSTGELIVLVVTLVWWVGFGNASASFTADFFSG